MALQDLTGCIAAILVFATFSAKRMVPLRTLGVASNVAFVAYASMAGLWPILLLHSILLPMNLVRLKQVLLCPTRLTQPDNANWRKEKIEQPANDNNEQDASMLLITFA